MRAVRLELTLPKERVFETRASTASATPARAPAAEFLITRERAQGHLERIRFTRKRSDSLSLTAAGLWPAPARARRIRGGPRSRPVARPSKTDALQCPDRKVSGPWCGAGRAAGAPLLRHGERADRGRWRQEEWPHSLRAAAARIPACPGESRRIPPINLHCLSRSGRRPWPWRSVRVSDSPRR